MVNSKKMSKSSIAVIVLAILLALSMVLGLTGAWYTAQTPNASDGMDNSLVLRDQWFTLSVGSTGEMGVTRDIDGDKTFGEENVAGEVLAADEETGVYTVMPGDRVSLDGKVTLTITKTQEDGPDVDFYYIIVKDGAVVGTTASKANTADTINLDVTIAPTVKTLEEKEGLDDKTDYYEVNIGLTSASAGQEVASVKIASVEVYAVQAENMTADDAFTYLSGLANA